MDSGAFLQQRPGHPLLQLIRVVAAKFAKRYTARGRDWVQSGRRSIGPSMDQGLDLLQLDRLAPTIQGLTNRKGKVRVMSKTFPVHDNILHIFSLKKKGPF